MERIMKQITHFTILMQMIFLVSCQSQNQSGADTVFRNGEIYTVDGDRTWAQSIAIQNGRITYVGNDDAISEHIGAQTKVIDLKGKMMIPGMQDIHIHPIYGGIEYSSCNLNNLAGIDDYRRVISEYAAANPNVEWILGGGWSMAAFGPGGSPHRNVIDELVSDRPVFLTSADGHTGWANTHALELAGITHETPDPVDGRIDRDPETGEIIGSLQEGAMSLVSKIIPPADESLREEGLRYAIEMLNGFGITSIQDAMVNAKEYNLSNELETYQTLEQQGELTLRGVTSLWWAREKGLEQIEGFKALRDKYNSKLIKASTVKIMQDGVMENYTAALLKPYIVPSKTRGIPMVEGEFLKSAVTALDKSGFQVHFHAIGDRAIRQSLDAVEESMYENGQLGHRHHISHLQLIDPDDIGRFAELSVVANFQPLWAYADDYITELTAPFLGEERMRWMYPIRSVQESGGKIAFGSDWSVSSANPFQQMETAVTRLSATELTPLEHKLFNASEVTPLVIEESIDIASAIEAFTINAAFVNKSEHETGSIEVGKYADLVVLDQNLFNIDAKDISNTIALLTLFEGEIVHGSLAL